MRTHGYFMFSRTERIREEAVVARWLHYASFLLGLLFNREHGSDMFLRNFGLASTDSTVSYFSRFTLNIFLECYGTWRFYFGQAVLIEVLMVFSVPQRKFRYSSTICRYHFLENPSASIIRESSYHSTINSRMIVIAS
jgi:hypothetical protein